MGVRCPKSTVEQGRDLRRNNKPKQFLPGSNDRRIRGCIEQLRQMLRQRTRTAERNSVGQIGGWREGCASSVASGVSTSAAKTVRNSASLAGDIRPSSGIGAAPPPLVAKVHTGTRLSVSTTSPLPRSTPLNLG